ncbi:odorant receptor 131-2-like [Rhinophrynus dorsalis]
MASSTELYRNMTQAQVYNKTSEIVRTAFLIIMLIFFCFFLYFITVMLTVYFTNSQIRETARYVLFVHMFINDTLNLFVTLLQFASATYSINIPIPVCWIMIIFSKMSFSVTPLNLAVMSLERYIAICHPLRHAEVCTSQRSNISILAVWSVAIIPICIEFATIGYLFEKNGFAVNAMCYWTSQEMSRVQSTIRYITDITSFVIVALIILYTYVGVMLVARKIGSGKSSALKAAKTVMLHAVQLLLCMSSFTATLTETYLSNYIPFIRLINFFLFMFLPRIISPLIYGMREEMFRKHVWRLCSKSKIDVHHS